MQPSKSTSTFFKPYRQYEKHSYFDSNSSPNKKYLFRNIDSYKSPQRHLQNRLYDGETYMKKKKNKNSPQKLRGVSKSASRQRIRYNTEDEDEYYDRIKRQIKNQEYLPVWEKLYELGREVRRQHESKAQRNKQKVDTQCTFQPMIKKSNRYLIPQQSNFLERNRIWNETRIQKNVKEKEQEVTKGLEDCTFKPKINDYYKLKSPLKNNYRNSRSKSPIGISQNLSRNNLHEKKPDHSTKEDIGKLKNIIRKQLKRIQL